MAPMSTDAILDALDPEQRAVATALTGPVCVLAGAGTGKTRAITHRIAYGVRVGAFNPHAVLAVTFTARAAGEMRTRLRLLGVDGVQARTFHAAALRQLSYFWPQVVGGQMPAIVEHKAQLVARAASATGLSVDRLVVRDLAAEIEWAKVSLVGPDDYVAVTSSLGRPSPAGLEKSRVIDVMRAYEDAKTDAVALDFEDILLLLADIMARHQEVSDQIRRQYRHFVVDEYQDVSALQQYVLDQWLGGRNQLCVVGDPAQTIYSFAGASPQHLLGFTRKYPDATVVRLVRDYRSTPQVVSLANGLMAQRGASSDGVELVAQRPSGPAVGFHAYADDESEAAGVASRIEGLISSGVAARDIAVLYRTNSQSEALEQALAARSLSYVVRGGQRFFDREEVRKAIVLLRGAAVAPGEESLGIAARDALSGAGWSPEPPAARGAVRERWDALQALAELADDFDAESHAATGEAGTLRDFVEHLAVRAQAQHAPTVDGVTLSTIHAAKGLEWEALFVVGLSEGLLPIALAETDAAVDEERRLLYVAITRARVHLSLSFARARREGGKASRKRTRFLEKWWPDARAVAPARRTRASHLELDAAGAALFDELKAWRLGIATETSKPAFTVLVDSTLVAIAQTRPRSLGELAAIHGIGASKLTAYGARILEIVERSQ